jgi:hypothetical protein
MRRCKCDPRWINVRFKGNACVCCKRPLHPGKRAFYYPEDRFALLRRRGLRQGGSWEFSARAFNEDNNTSV